jgi:hypothetical protein
MDVDMGTRLLLYYRNDYDRGFAFEFLCIEFPIHSCNSLFSVLSLSYSSLTVSIRSKRAVQSKSRTK